MKTQKSIGQRKMPRPAVAAAIIIACIAIGGVAEATTGVVSSVIRKVYYVEATLDTPGDDGMPQTVILRVTEEVTPDE